MAGERDRSQPGDGEEEQHRRPAPGQHHPATQREEERDRRGDEPGLGLLDGVDESDQRLGRDSSPTGLPAPSAALNRTSPTEVANQTHAAIPAVRRAA